MLCIDIDIDIEAKIKKMEI